MRLLCLLISLLLFPSCSVLGDPQAKVTIKVVDEQHQPIKDAVAGATFWGRLPPNKIGTEAPPMKTIKGITDDQGIVSVTNETCGVIGVGAAKDGYYESGVRLEFDAHKEKRTAAGVLLPLEKNVELILKKKGKVVPMYMNSIGIRLPVLGKPVGYDLKEGDIVKPYGRGEISDFILQFDGEYVDRNNRTQKLALTFSNPNDGIQEVIYDRKGQSEYNFMREAPEQGYVHKFESTGKTVNGKRETSKREENMNYVFRVRTEVDKKGNIVKAWYGKIYGNIVYTDKRPEVVYVDFEYYLNPDGTRNLEEDKNQNLLQGK